MSVINFSYQEIDDLTEGVKSYYNRGDSKSYFKNTKAYMKYSYGEKDFDKLIDELIERCFWYLFISNQICYSLQYREPIDIFNQPEPVKSYKSFTTEELLKRLNSLNYNIYTNDGNKFIEPDFYELFEIIRDSLKDSIVDNIIYKSTIDFNND